MTTDPTRKRSALALASSLSVMEASLANVQKLSQAEGEAIAIGADGLPFPQTFDGMTWATEFNKRFPSVPVDDALGWMCNAIMRGFDEAQAQQQALHLSMDQVAAILAEIHADPTKADLLSQAIERRVAAIDAEQE